MPAGPYNLHLLGTSSQDHDNYDKTQPLAGEDAWEIDS